MIDTIHDLEVENLQLKEQLTKRDKEIEELKAKLETAEYWNKKYDDLQSQKDIQTIRKQVCDEIRESAKYTNWSKVVPFVYVITPEQLSEIEKEEQAKAE